MDNKMEKVDEAALSLRLTAPALDEDQVWSEYLAEQEIEAEMQIAFDEREERDEEDLRRDDPYRGQRRVVYLYCDD